MQGRLGVWAGAWVVCAALASGCGSKTTLADQLTPTTGLTATALALSLSTPPVGGSVQAVATATYSNGSTGAVNTGFSSDTPSVATSTGTGRVSGVAIGDVTIAVDYQGLRATKKVHVLPSYAGTFSGTYVVASCTQTDGFADPTVNICGSVTPGLPLSVAFQHTASDDLSTITGQFVIFGFGGSGTGTVSPTGALAYTGALVGTTTRMDFRNFTATSPEAGHVVGSFESVWTDSTITGQALIVATNLDMTRVSSAASVPMSFGASTRSAGLRDFTAMILRRPQPYL